MCFFCLLFFSRYHCYKSSYVRCSPCPSPTSLFVFVFSFSHLFRRPSFFFYRLSVVCFRLDPPPTFSFFVRFVCFSCVGYSFEFFPVLAPCLVFVSALHLPPSLCSSSTGKTNKQQKSISTSHLWAALRMRIGPVGEERRVGRTAANNMEGLASLQEGAAPAYRCPPRSCSIQSTEYQMHTNRRLVTGTGSGRVIGL